MLILEMRKLRTLLQFSTLLSGEYRIQIQAYIIPELLSLTYYVTYRLRG